MSQKVDLFNDAWIDLLFKDRNKQYGAFDLRKDSSRRHVWGMIVTLILLALLIFVPVLYKQILANKKEKNTEVTVLSNIEIDQKIEKPKDLVIETPPPAVKSAIKFTPPVIKPDEEVSDEEVIKTQEELTNTNISISVADVKGNDEVNGMDIADLNEQIVNEEDSVKPPLTIVEQMPEFPGGEKARNDFLVSNIVYPPIAQERGIQGRVYVNFVVEKNGSISNVNVMRGIDPSLNNEAVRVVKKMPKWIAGKQNGETVRVSFVLPVNFELK